MKKQNKTIPDQTVKYFDTATFKLLELITIERVSVSSNNPVSSIQEMNIHEISSVGKMLERQGHSIYEIDKGEKIGFSEKNGIEFYKFVRNVYQIHQIKQRTSEEYIENVTFEWLISTKKNGKADSNFSSHLLTKIDEAVKEYKIFYLIQYLHIDQSFKIGEIEISFFTKDYFNRFSELAVDKSVQNDYTEFGKRYSGKVYAMCLVKSEIERAKQLGLEECTLAVDILKICSITLVIPSYPCSFGIDVKLNRNTDNELIVERIDPQQLSISSYGSGNPFILNGKQMVGFKERGLEVFSEFLKSLSFERTELEQIILQSMQRLSQALSVTDLHQRIADLFSILESILLMNDSGNMTDTVCKYLCRLLFKNHIEREQSIKLYKELYKVRSAWVHHAKQIKFDEKNLAKLQMYVHRVLIVLIKKTKTHQEKESVLREIDIAILSA